MGEVVREPGRDTDLPRVARPGQILTERDAIEPTDLGFRDFDGSDCSAEAVAMRRERIEQFVADIAAMPVVDKRTPLGIKDDLNAL